MGTATRTSRELLRCPLVATTTLARCSTFGNARHDELLGTDDDGAIDVAEMYRRAAQFARTQAAAHDANFASGQSAMRIDGVDMRIAVEVQCGHDADLVFHCALVHAESVERQPNKWKCSSNCNTMKP